MCRRRRQVGSFSLSSGLTRSLDDANFAVATANAAILSLTTEEEFIRTVVDGELQTVEKAVEEFNFFVCLLTRSRA